MITKEDWAQHWALQGFYVFPVHKDTKRPAIAAWPSAATRDPAQIATWWSKWPDANIGAHPGASGHAVIDVDVKDGQPGEASFAGLELMYGALPDTFAVRTASGGRHYWLCLSECGNSTSRVSPAIDIKSQGGYVLMPGSSTAAGEYSALTETAPAPAPPAWADALRASTVREERKAAENVVTDTPEQVAEAQQYLDGLVKSDDVAVEGRGGNNRTFRLAAMLRDMGLSLDAALDVIGPWNAACSPPWDAGELAAVFTNAYAYAQNDAGAKSSSDPGGAGFACLPTPDGPAEPPPQSKREKFRLLSLTDMDSLPEPAWLAPGWVPLYALTLVYGAPGSMKSFAALDLALSVASGRPAWGMDYATKPHPVVYIAGEGQAGLARKRIPAWMQARNENTDIPFFLVLEVPRAAQTESDLTALFASIEAEGSLPRLVVFDTHARVTAGLDENAAKDTNLAIDLYSAVIRRYSCAVVVIHHSGKNGEMRGSNALLAASDAVIHLEYDKAAKVAAMTAERMKDGEPGKPVAFKPVRSGPSIVLEQKEIERMETAPTELFLEAARILTEHEAHTLGTALTTKQLTRLLSAVRREESGAAQENAAVRMERILRTAAKTDCKTLSVGPDLWGLPAPA